MTGIREDHVYVRYPRRRGAVLVVGAGAVGGLVAQELALAGISPMWLVDKDKVEEPNLPRQPYGEDDLGQSKAYAFARRIRRDFSLCEAQGIFGDFTTLSHEDQVRLASQVHVVVAATDEIDCQRQINQACLDAGQPAVFPSVWVRPGIQPAEVGEVLWVAPGQDTPCYGCYTTWRGRGSDAEARGGTRLDIYTVVLATAKVVLALLDPEREESGLVDRNRNLILVHSLMPASEPVENFRDGLGSRNIRVWFPTTRCAACGSRRTNQDSPGAWNPRPRRLRPRLPDVSFTVSVDYPEASIDTSATIPQTGVTFDYDWGDGKSTARPSHRYAEPNTYTVRVTAINAAGSSVAALPVAVTAPVAHVLSAPPSSGDQAANSLPASGPVAVGSSEIPAETIATTRPSPSRHPQPARPTPPPRRPPQFAARAVSQNRSAAPSNTDHPSWVHPALAFVILALGLLTISLVAARVGGGTARGPDSTPVASEPTYASAPSATPPQAQPPPPAVPAVGQYFQMADFTSACRYHYPDYPNAEALVRPTADQPPAYWVRCFEGRDQIRGSGDLYLDDYCAAIHSGTRADTPKRNDWSATQDGWLFWACVPA